MEIWLNYEEDEYRFPILPSSFEIQGQQGNTSVTVHSVGEVNLLGNANLKTVEISSFFPAQEYPFCQYIGFDLDPYVYVKKIENWKEKKYTPRLIITETNINLIVSIENFSYGENDATGDVYFTLSLKEYKNLTYTKRPIKKTKTIKYTVKKGDTLKKIAKAKTGSSSNWKKIYQQNKKVIENAAKKHKRKTSQNGKYLYKGTKLVIKI